MSKVQKKKRGNETRTLGKKGGQTTHDTLVSKNEIKK